MFQTLVVFVAALMIGPALLLLGALLWVARYENRQRRLSDEYIRLVEEQGFRSHAEAIACMDAIRESNYERAVLLLTHGR
jgi:hypothetical protein